VVQAGTEITFDLTRGKGDDSAPRSTVKLPERVRLTAPLAGATYSRRAAIPVRIATGPSDLPSILTWTGDCIQPDSLELEPGRTSATIPPGSHRPATTCSVNLTLTRRTEGTLDKSFKNGHITAETQSVRRITSMP
jgi:hypothetical protein